MTDGDRGPANRPGRTGWRLAAEFVRRLGRDAAVANRPGRDGFRLAAEFVRRLGEDAPVANQPRRHGRRLAASGAALVLVAGAAAQDASAWQAGAAERVYVANQAGASVSVVDAESGAVVETVELAELGFDANSRPHDTAVEPDGSHWYVSLIGGGHVLRFTSRNEPAGRVAFETPGLLAVDAASDLLYVGRSMMAVNPPQRIGAIDRRRMTIEEIDVFFPRPHALAVDPGRARVFSASLVENRMALVDAGSGQVDLVDVPGPQQHTLVQFALSPDGARFVATAQLTGKLLVFDAARGRLAAELDVGTQPWHPVFSVDGERVYFGAKDDDAVVVVNARTWQVEKRITAPGIAEPHGSAVTADGRWLFVSNRNLKGTYEPRRPVERNSDVGTLVKIDTRSLEVVQTIEVGAYPAGISIGPAR